MNSPASGAVAVTKALSAIMRDDRGRLLSALIARVRDFQLAEDALQDAMVSAVTHWNRTGLPNSPHGWLLQAAYRKCIDRIRQKKTATKFGQEMVHLSPSEAYEDAENDIPDERLRLIFTCCHPALEPKSQVALTLRTLGGLTTTEIAKAFLDQETTMGQRLSRAKAKIVAAKIPYHVPEPEEWPERLQSVLSVIYLIFNAGYSAGPQAGRDLADEALFLSRLMNKLRPEDPEIEASLALVLITHARRNARVDEAGVAVPPGRQDRSLWQMNEINAGLDLLDVAIARGRPGPYQIKAAISACHVREDTPDWLQISALYDSLIRFEPTAIVQVNRAVAYAQAGAQDLALKMLSFLQGELADYQPFHAAHADILAKNGHVEDARAAYDRAIELAVSEADVAFLQKQREAIAAVGKI
jgi:RNA polymerase sigma-70 factor (ECF subfamily)